MKTKILCIFMSIVLLLSIIIIPVSASDSETYGWYCKRAKDHLRPPLPSEFDFIRDSDGFYIGSDPDKKVIYLTFDAGYENGNVKKTLDILKQNEVQGAFFILSNLIKTSPDIVKRMVDEGHTVCNHTSTHKDVSKLNNYESFKNELVSLEKVYQDIIGGEVSKYFRPPEGKFSKKSLLYAKQMGYKTIFWSFAYADWDNNNQMSPEAATKKIMDNIHPGAVLLLHPTSEVNVLILDNIIKTLKNMGYSFGSLDELTE